LHFLLLTTSPLAGTKDNASTPKFDSIRVDALDADAWNGVVFAARGFGQPSDFAFRFGSFSQTAIDGPAILALACNCLLVVFFPLHTGQRDLFPNLSSPPKGRRDRTAVTPRR
jgi:hypothetical protein